MFLKAIPKTFKENLVFFEFLQRRFGYRQRLIHNLKDFYAPKHENTVVQCVVQCFLCFIQELEWPGQIHDNAEDPHKHIAEEISSAYEVMQRLIPQDEEARISLDSCNDQPKVATGEQSTQNRSRNKMASNDAAKEQESTTAYQYHTVDDDSASLMWVPFQSVDDEYLQDQHSSFISDQCFSSHASDELSLASGEHLNLNDGDEEKSVPQRNSTQEVESSEFATESQPNAEVVCKSTPRNSRVKRSRSKPDEGLL
jgi:hypothetical protein